MKPISNYWQGDLWSKQKKKTFILWITSLLVIIACAIMCALTDDLYGKLGLIALILVAGYVLYGARGYYEDYRRLEAALNYLEESPKQSITQLAEKVHCGRREMLAAIDTAIRCGAFKDLELDEAGDHIIEKK
ncbi:MAG: hypothetical protein Q4D21_08825 [Phascolarctobacterium sp.]|nr:hypothetical protein [Phascolarctobacterium sp.]MDO4179272.1 hypothetical protein [Phascolarctobacterium sp.]